MASSYHHLQNRGYSKAQMCLFKILHTISSIPPSQNAKQEQARCKGATGINLNLRFSSSESQSSAESESSAIDQGNNERGRELEEEEAEAVGEKSVELSGTQVQNNEVDHVESETVSFRRREHESNCLDLLIEAARVLSAKEDELNTGGLSGESKTRGASEGSELLDFEGGVKKRNDRWVEPVVRSKRGRNQALPYRFRDSVVEPLKRMSSSNPHARNKRLNYNVKR